MPTAMPLAPLASRFGNEAGSTSGFSSGQSFKTITDPVRTGEFAAVYEMAGGLQWGSVNLDVPGTGISLIMGPNGSGKTSLMKTMYGLQRPNSGDIIWHDEATSDQKSFVFQTPVIMRRSVLDNLAYPLQIGGHKRAVAREMVMETATRFGLTGRLHLQASRLSGGEKQKLAVARALTTKPSVLFLDEPTANLDGQSTREIEDTLLRVAKEGTKVLLASHDLSQAKRLAQDIVLLHKGEMIETGPATAFFKKPTSETGRAYLNGEILI